MNFSLSEITGRLQPYVLGWLARKYPISVRVHTEADVTFATSGVAETISWTNVRYDLPGDPVQWEGVTHPSRLTCQFPGLYFVYAQASWIANNTGVRDLMIFQNGVIIAQDRKQASADAARGTVNQCLAVALMASGDYMECQGRQYSGGSLAILHANAYTPEFGMYRLV